MLTVFVSTLMSAEADAVCGAPYGMPDPDRVNGGDRRDAAGGGLAAVPHPLRRKPDVRDPKACWPWVKTLVVVEGEVIRILLHHESTRVAGRGSFAASKVIAPGHALRAIATARRIVLTAVTSTVHAA
jgi:hypothetical protein